MVVVEWCTLQAAAPRTSTRTHAQTSRQTQHERKDEWTGGSIGTHAHAHAHAYRRARPGSTLHRRRARVRGTAVCRRTGYLGPRRPRWRWARAYMSECKACMAGYGAAQATDWSRLGGARAADRSLRRASWSKRVPPRLRHRLVLGGSSVKRKGTQHLGGSEVGEHARQPTAVPVGQPLRRISVPHHHVLGLCARQRQGVQGGQVVPRPAFRGPGSVRAHGSTH